MTRNEILLRVSAIVQKFFDTDSNASVSNELVLLGEGGVFDSVTALELVLALEQAFSIVIEDEDIRPENLKSIESIAAFVEAALSRHSHETS